MVAGVRTPKNIAEMVEEMPESFDELLRTREKLEQHFRDMQDFEFTIEQGKLYLLQTRNGKRTGQAAVRIAVEMQRDGLMDDRTALLKVPAESIDSLLVPVFDPQALLRLKLLPTDSRLVPVRHRGKSCSLPSLRAVLLTQEIKSCYVARKRRPKISKACLFPGHSTARGGVRLTRHSLLVSWARCVYAALRA
ncbi:MAG: hypothetical protein CM1200mP9_05570 [Gammaproteobacteria bacterium]|nr:MAG: hypothetical protein CM1200mP9_05570 [Gammaproteobacteria bacterium]